jgi:hypothetical protein
MIATETLPALKCSMCGVTDEQHRSLYATPLGQLSFTFHPDKGEPVCGEVLLCRPCTHGVLPRRLLRAAGVAERQLAPEVWS